MFLRGDSVQFLIHLGPVGSALSHPFCEALPDALSLSLGVTAKKQQSRGVGGAPDAELNRLIEGLKETGVMKLKDTVDSLRRLGDDRAVEPLLPLLKHDSWRTRFKAFQALGVLGGPRATEALIKVVEEDPDNQNQYHAAKALGRIGNSDAIPALSRMLTAERRQYRSPISALLKLSAPVTDTLLEMLRSDDKETQVRALADLGWIKSTEIIDPLIAALRDKNEVVRKKAEHVLICMRSPAAVEPLLARIKDEDPKLRANVVHILGHSEGDLRVLEPLRQALEDPVREVRREAAFALYLLKFPQAADDFLRILNEWRPDPEMQLWSIKGLGAIEEPRAVEPLVALLDSRDQRLREAAAHNLGKILGKTKDLRHVDSLFAALRKEGFHSEECTKALIAFGEPVVEPLIRMATPLYPEEKIARALGEIGDKRAIAPLIDRLKKSDGPGPRANYLSKALGALGVAAVEPLLQALEDGVSGMSEAFATVGPPAVDGLLVATGHANPAVRVEAMQALAKMRDPRGLEAILRTLETDEDPEMRKKAVEILRCFKDPKAIDALIRATREEGLFREAVWSLYMTQEPRAYEHILSLFPKEPRRHRREWSKILNHLRGWEIRQKRKKEKPINR